jgi:ABC-type transporter Mla subunit MlaD
MTTVEELVVKATPKGMGEVNDQLEGMEQKTQEATEEVEETGRSLGDMSAKFKGAMGAIIGGLSVAAGGILSRVPSIQAAVQQLGTTLDLLGQSIEQEFSDSLGTLNEDLAETNRKVDEADGPVDALTTAIDGVGQSIQNAAVGAFQRKIQDLTGVKIPKNWLDFGWDVITMDFNNAVNNLESIILDFIHLDFPEGTFMDKLVDETEGMRRQIKRIFRETSNSIINRWTRFTNNLQQELNEFTDNFVEEIKLLWPRTKEKFNSLQTKVSQVFSDIASDAKQSGSNLVNNFAEGLRDNIPTAEGAASELAGAVRDILPSSPAKTGPLSDLDETGPGMVDTFSAGVSDSVGRIDGGLVDGDPNTGGNAGAAIARNNGRTVIEIEGRQVERATRDFRSDGTDLRGRYG